jgi:Na+/H+ antiporter NhaD/arsenite permease-like protein
MDPVVIIVFAVVYFGMMVGRIHGLALDRTGIALLGAIALLAAGRVGLQEAWDAVDVATIALLLGLMIVSAQLRLGGFYSRLAGAVVGARVSPAALLALLIGVAGLLSAVLVNDVVCLAMAPVLVEGCGRRGLNPVPFLLALACAANVGSAATLIGNPQNILIGQVLHLSFTRYLLMAGVPSALGLALTWLIIRAVYRNRWQAPAQLAQAVAPPYSAWQTAKGLAVVGALMAAFLFTPWPRAVLALSAGALLLTSRRMASRPMLAAVDWHLLVLFVGLFVVNHVVGTSGLLAREFGAVAAAGVDLGRPGGLFGTTVVLSNLVSNVPATMLLLPAATYPLAGPILALASTLAGNLLIVGSIANIIVVDQGQRLGVKITWLEHAKVGVPVTLVTLAVAAGWLYLVAAAGV